jgi:hypothetical protein
MSITPAAKPPRATHSHGEIPRAEASGMVSSFEGPSLASGGAALQDI